MAAVVRPDKLPVASWLPLEDKTGRGFGPGSEVRSGNPLAILPLTTTETTNRPASGSA